MNLTRMPEINTVIACNPSHVTFMQSAVPLIRAQFRNGYWQAVDPAKQAGLIVFIDRQDPDLKAVKVTRIHGLTSAEAVQL